MYTVQMVSMTHCSLKAASLKVAPAVWMVGKCSFWGRGRKSLCLPGSNSWVSPRSSPLDDLLNNEAKAASKAETKPPGQTAEDFGWVRNTFVVLKPLVFWCFQSPRHKLASPDGCTWIPFLFLIRLYLNWPSLKFSSDTYLWLIFDNQLSFFLRSVKLWSFSAFLLVPS